MAATSVRTPPALWRLGAIALAAVLLLAGPVSTAEARPKSGAVRALADRHQIGQARYGVVLIDAQTGETLASVNADEPFIPASNMKLLTSGAALSVLGADFVFRTELIRDGAQIVLRGSGDPALGDMVLLRAMNMSVEDILDSWADAIVRSGDVPPTEIVIDDRVFDREFVHPSWPTEQLNRWYCAQVSGLNFHTNVLAIFPTPARDGGAPQITLEPRADWLNVSNRATTAREGNNTLWASRPNNSNTITLFGAVRAAPADPLEVTVHDPASFVGRLLQERLAQRGVPGVRFRLAGENEPLAQGRTLAVIRSPLEVVLRRCNVNSHNLYADALLKRLGHQVTGTPGSWDNGAAIVRMVMQQRLGPRDASALIVADGSGMSRENRVTPGMMARWLVSFHKDAEIGEAFIQSLPLAQAEGSMRRRLHGRALDLEVRAKTGYIRQVSTLSGYVTDPNTGRRVVFSVLVNDIPARVGTHRARSFQDDVAQLAHDWLAEQVQRTALGG